MLPTELRRDAVELKKKMKFDDTERQGLHVQGHDWGQIEGREAVSTVYVCALQGVWGMPLGKVNSSGLAGVSESDNHAPHVCYTTRAIC